MNYAERRQDPRWQQATALVTTALLPSWDNRLPRDPHAAENLRYGVCMLATSEDEGQALDAAIRQYIGLKYQNTLRADCERIARSAARAVT